MERGGVIYSVGCGTAGNAESGTGEITCGASRKAGLSQSILTVSTHVTRFRVKYLSLCLRTLYGPLYGQSRKKQLQSRCMKTCALHQIARNVK